MATAVIDGIQIDRIRITNGQIELDDPSGTGKHVRTDRAPQVDQVGLGAALARQQDEVGAVHRPNRLGRQVIGIARPYADEVQVDH